jgi:hypothetical protein
VRALCSIFKDLSDALHNYAAPAEHRVRRMGGPEAKPNCANVDGVSLAARERSPSLRRAQMKSTSFFLFT